MSQNKDVVTAFSLLLEIGLRTKHEWARVTDKFGVTPIQFYILEILTKNPLPMQGICCLLGCDASNVTGVVDRLEAHELIERRAQPSDRRVRLVTLTDKGKHVHARLVHALAADDSSLLHLLTPDQLQQLNGLLAKLACPQDNDSK